MFCASHRCSLFHILGQSHTNSLENAKPQGETRSEEHARRIVYPRAKFNRGLASIHSVKAVSIEEESALRRMRQCVFTFYFDQWTEM